MDNNINLKECKEYLFNIKRLKIIKYIEKEIIPYKKKGEIPKNGDNKWDDDSWVFEKDKIEELKKNLLTKAYNAYYWSEDKKQFSAMVFVTALVKKGALKAPQNLESQIEEDEEGKKVKTNKIIAYADESQFDSFLTFLMEEYIPKQLLVYQASNKQTSENSFIYHSSYTYAIKQYIKKQYLKPDELPSELFDFSILKEVKETYESSPQFVDKPKNVHKRVKIKHIQFSEEYIKQPYDHGSRLIEELKGILSKTILPSIEEKFIKATSKSKADLSKQILYIKSILYYKKEPDRYPDPDNDKELAERCNCKESRIRQIRQKIIAKAKNVFKNLGYFD